ncbi:hypothetical protein O3P69_012920 [Scylla paramamosain]|uniref:Uncharacterized protein n=1 Tax=Scylla paramamosain TaxID=85552 RepID=A0AAW0TUT1_SCYPA
MERHPPSATSAAPGLAEVPQATPASRGSRGAPVTPALMPIAAGRGRTMTATTAAGGGPGTGTEANTSAAVGGADAARDKDKQRQDKRPATHPLQLHHALLPHHTCVKKLPFMKDVWAKETRDKVPMWKPWRENKYISKYRLPAEERRKHCED